MKATAGITFCLLVLLASSPASAHHAFAVEFDASKCSDLIGTLTKVRTRIRTPTSPWTEKTRPVRRWR